MPRPRFAVAHYGHPLRAKCLVDDFGEALLQPGRHVGLAGENEEVAFLLVGLGCIAGLQGKQT